MWRLIENGIFRKIEILKVLLQNVPLDCWGIQTNKTAKNYALQIQLVNAGIQIKLQFKRKFKFSFWWTIFQPQMCSLSLYIVLIYKCIFIHKLYSFSSSFK